MSTPAGTTSDGVFPDGFDDLGLSRIPVGEVTLRVRHGGSGPPLLLLHGYPETHLAWENKKAFPYVPSRPRCPVTRATASGPWRRTASP